MEAGELSADSNDDRSQDSFKKQSSNNGVGNRRNDKPRNNRKVDQRSDGAYSRSRSPSVRSRSPPSRGRTPRTPSPKTPPPRTPSPRRDRKRSRSESPAESERRHSSPKRKKETVTKIGPHTLWTPVEQVPHQAGVEEAHDQYGVKCVVVRYDTEESGVLRCEGGTEDIIFHVNQVWLNESGSWIQFREAYPSSALAIRFPLLKSRLKCNLRAVRAGDYQWQATVVWPEGKSPSEYRTKDWFDDIQRIASCVRNKSEITSHLSSSSPMEGVIQEYISFETGVIRILEGDKCCALFSIENFWLTHEKEFKPLR